MTEPKKEAPKATVKCLNGKTHDSNLEAAYCNANIRLTDFIMEGEPGEHIHRAYVVDMTGLTAKELSETLPAPIMAAMLNQELRIVLHWVTSHPDFLEAVIGHFLEESNEGLLEKTLKQAPKA